MTATAAAALAPAGVCERLSQRPEDGVQITSAMDRFAKPPVNDMPACVTPDDLA